MQIQAHNELSDHTEVAQFEIQKCTKRGKDLMPSNTTNVKYRNVLEREYSRQGRATANKKQFVLHVTHW